MGEGGVASGTYVEMNHFTFSVHGGVVKEPL